ncbi:MAG: enoyl-CoA hydratase-related protein [Deltaproteobacteria bacterium]|nr:enoyl-CoA hydratase-related protein [Deltaproteobacteria bacterium]
MPYEQITYDAADGIATITLNRPEKLNAWTPIMGAELMDAFRAADRDASVRAILFTGAGERAFCAGADMGFFAGQIAAGGGTGSGGGPSRVVEFPLLMRGLSKPSIAVLNGYALGIGATMPLLCDIRLACAEAQIGFLFSRMGVMAELGSTYLLPRIVGTARACELMLTGKRFSAAECERMGLVNHVVPRAELLATARALANEVAQSAPLSVMLTRQAIYQGLESSFEAQVRFEGYTLDHLYRTADHAEAVAAFREKRPPKFSGR